MFGQPMRRRQPRVETVSIRERLAYQGIDDAPRTGRRTLNGFFTCRRSAT